jgi:hypothetical protein
MIMLRLAFFDGDPMMMLKILGSDDEIRLWGDLKSVVKLVHCWFDMVFGLVWVNSCWPMLVRGIFTLFKLVQV